MSEATRPKGLSFEEKVKKFRGWSKEKGPKYYRELGVDMYLDGEDIGYIMKDGRVTTERTITVQDPSRIWTVSVDLTLEQWEEIGKKAREFKEKCAHPEFIDPAEQEARKSVRIAQDGISDAEKAQIAPLARLDMTPTGAEAKVLEMLLRGPSAMNDPAYTEACQALDQERQSPPGTPGFNTDTYSLPCEKDPDAEV